MFLWVKWQYKWQFAHDVDANIHTVPVHAIIRAIAILANIYANVCAIAIHDVHAMAVHANIDVSTIHVDILLSIHTHANHAELARMVIWLHPSVHHSRIFCSVKKNINR